MSEEPDREDRDEPDAEENEPSALERGDEADQDAPSPRRKRNDEADEGEPRRKRAAAAAADEPGAGEILVESDSAFADLTRPSRRHRLAAFFGLLFVGLAAFGTGIFLFDHVLMPRLIHGVAEVRVPDLTNLSLEEGEKLLSAVGLRLTREGERFDPGVPRGLIVSQDPPPDTPVRGHRRVSVVISLGEEFSSVPELFGESVRGARVLLERSGLRAAGITHAPSDQVGEGLVVATDPPAETVLRRGAPVGLLVSSGSGLRYYVMPDLLGREITGATRLLESLGFKITVPPGSPPMGTIVMQIPSPGSRVAPGDPITLQATRRIIR
jgi:beta-lactam-binding protein with PASTA domain